MSPEYQLFDLFGRAANLFDRSDKGARWAIVKVSGEQLEIVGTQKIKQVAQRIVDHQNAQTRRRAT